MCSTGYRYTHRHRGITRAGPRATCDKQDAGEWRIQISVQTQMDPTSTAERGHPRAQACATTGPGPAVSAPVPEHPHASSMGFLRERPQRSTSGRFAPGEGFGFDRFIGA